MTRNDGPLVHGAMVRGHISAAMLWLCISLFAGLFYSLQLVQHWPLPKIEILSPGRPARNRKRRRPAPLELTLPERRP